MGMLNMGMRGPSHVHRIQRFLTVPIAMDASDGAGTVAYDIPGSFKALSLRSMNERLLDDIRTYCMQPLRFPPNSRKFRRSIQVDGHLERGVLS
jgi:hypothetical protein